MRWKVGSRFFVLIFVQAAAILMFAGWQAYRSTTQFAKAAEWQKSTYEILVTLNETLAQFGEVESAERGYVVTGDEAYLSPYREDIKNLDQLIDHLTDLTSSNPSQLQRIQKLKPLVEKRIAAAQEVIELRQTQGFDAAHGMLTKGQGTIWMNEIRAQVTEIADQEKDLLKVRTQEANEKRATSGSIIFAGTCAGLFLLIVVFALLNHELSERKRAQEDLSKSEKWSSTTLAGIGDAVIATDMNGTVTFMNPVAQSLTGWTQKEAVGKSLDFVLNVVDKESRHPIEGLVKKVFREGKVVDLVHRTLLLSRDGTEREIEGSAAPIHTGTGESLGIVLVLRDLTPKKLADEEIRRQKELLELILKSIADGVVVANAKGEFLLFNAASERILGTGPTNTGPEQWSSHYGAYLPDTTSVFPPSDLPLARAMRGENVQETEIFIRNANVPKGRFLSVSGRPLKGEDGALRGGVVVFRDISEHRRAEEALRQSEERYRLLFDNNPHPVGVYDSKTLAILDVNPAAIRNYGYSREEFLSLTIKDICPPEDIPAMLLSVSRVSPDTQSTGVLRHRKKDGTLIDVEVTAHPLVYAGRDARLVVATDITARKLVEERLRRSEESFRQLVEGVEDYAIFMLDREGLVSTWNNGAERIKGYKESEILGKHFSCFYPTADIETCKPQELLEIAKREGHVISEGWRIRKDGSRFWAYTVITALRDKQETLIGFSKITRDMTDRKNSEEALLHAKEEAERTNKFKSQFLSTMSHELRTPLNAVLGFSDLLTDERYGSLNDRQQRYVSHINAAGKHLLKLISDILDLSKIEAGRMDVTLEDVNVASAFGEVISALQPLVEKKSQSLVRQTVTDLCVRADPVRLKQVLMNLVGNALKFTPICGRIELAARPLGDKIRIEVRDNGPGIPQEEQDRIFEAFYRMAQAGSSPEGTGLGLAIAASLVALHGDKLNVESEPGFGTCFSFSLLTAEVARKETIPATVTLPIMRKAPQILTIEDNTLIGQLLASQLAAGGYEATICDQPERALEMAAKLSPDAITLDLLMKPIHGLDVLQQLKKDKRTTRIPVIVVTILDEPSVGIALGADEYLVKPVDKATLLGAVERCLYSRDRSVGPERTVLVVEDDLPTREMIVDLLKSCDCAVSTAGDGTEARRKVGQELPALVILDLMLPNITGFELLAEWRENPRTADLSVFVLTSKDLNREEEMFLREHAKSVFRKENSWRDPLMRELERLTSLISTPAVNS
jgi:PAS domain S-box-containing protein